MRNASLLSLTLVAVAFAGCAGGASDDPTALENEPEPAAEAVVEEGSGLGSIAGTILDDEGLPVKNADVAIVEDDAKTKSDSEGKFTFNDLEPGTKKVFVQRLGYESAGKSVAVTADQVASISFALIPIPVTEPFLFTKEENGYVTCAVGFPVLTVYPDAAGGVCSTLSSPDKRNIVIPVDIGTEESLSELAWEANQAAAGSSLRSVNDFMGTEVGQVDGASPLKFHYKGYDEGDEGDFEHFLWAAYGGANETNPGHSVNVVHEQHIKVFFTEFHYMEKPDGFSALPPE